MTDSLSLQLSRQYLNKFVDLVIDRPIDSLHPKYGFKYEANYGYIDGIVSPDGEDLDAYFLGVDEPLKTANGICIAIIHRLKNDDDKLVVVPEDKKDMTDQEILKAVNFQEKWFESEIVRN